MNQAVKDLDLYMYAGTWYEIGRNENPWQENCTYGISRYYVDDRVPGTPEMDFESDCISEDGRILRTSRARVTVPDSKNMGALRAKWEKGDEENWMIVYDTDYMNYTIEGDDQKRYLWIMSRGEMMDRELMVDLLLKARDVYGFDIEGVDFPPDSLVESGVMYGNDEVPRDRSYSPSCGCGGSKEESEDSEEDKSKSKSKSKSKDKSYGPRAQGRRRGRRRANRRNGY